MGFWTLSEVSRMVDMPVPTMQGHLKRGLIPAPNVRAGRVRVYDDATRDVVVAFYKTAYVPYQRGLGANIATK